MSDVSIREQIFLQIEAALGGAGKPESLTVHRERLRPIEKETLPSILIYAEDDAPKTLSGEVYGAPLCERRLSVAVECRAQGALDVPPDTALDPILIWATKAIMADEKFGGLANGTDELRTTWFSREGEIPVAAAAIHFTVKYRTATNDPTKKDPKL